MKAKKFREVFPIAMKPGVGTCFWVEPEAINEELFQKEREDTYQELTRRLIVEAIAEMKKYPEKYGTPFFTAIPEKTWSEKTVDGLEKVAKKMGGQMADWVHQALEWAQRLCNGESWEELCNDPDTILWYRLIKWKDGHARIVGSKYEAGSCVRVGYDACRWFNILFDTVPLIVVYQVMVVDQDNTIPLSLAANSN